MNHRQVGSTRLEIPKDNLASQWIEDQLSHDIGSVASIVPSSFDAYARILHPAYTHDGVPMRWSAVGATLGKEMHPLMQWHTLVGASDPDDLVDSEWEGSAPERGALNATILASLCSLLAQCTRDSEHCFFGLWAGWTSIEFRFSPSDINVSEENSKVSSGNRINAPIFELPEKAGRDYLLLRGPIDAAGEVPYCTDFAMSSPSMIWPADHSWFLASEIDFDSTLVGGCGGLIESIVNSCEVEAWQVGATDSLLADSG